MGLFSVLGDAWDATTDAVGSGFQWVGQKAEDVYNTGTKFVKENADTIADVAGVVGDVSAFLATGAAVIPGIGTAAAAGLAGLGAAGKGVEALAKGAKATTKAIDATGAAIDAMRAGDTEAAFKAAKQGIAAGKGVASAASAATKPFKKPDKEGELKKKEIERKKQTKKPKEEDKAKRQAVFDEFR